MRHPAPHSIPSPLTMTRNPKMIDEHLAGPTDEERAAPVRKRV
jgi:hypothetical protein